MQLNKSWMRGVEGRSRHCGSSLDSLPQSLHRTPIVLPTRPSLRPVSCDLGQRAKKVRKRGEKRKFLRVLQATATAHCLLVNLCRMAADKSRTKKTPNMQTAKVFGNLVTVLQHSKKTCTASQQWEQNIPILNQYYKKCNVHKGMWLECNNVQLWVS